MTVFHIAEAGTSDPELAELLRDQARAAGSQPGTARPGRILGALANSLDPASGKQLGSVEGLEGLHHHARLAVGDVLAAGVARARAAQHPAAERLAGVAERWSAFTSAAEAA